MVNRMTNKKHPPYLSQAAFARDVLGKHRSYVTQLKQEGRLVMEGKRVDVVASLAKIAATADPNRDDVKARHAAERGDAADDDLQLDTQASAKAQVTFVDGRAKEQHFKALRAELDYQKEVGQVVEMEGVRQVVAGVVTEFKQTLENWPHRTAPELVGKDLETTRKLLRDAVVDVLGAMQQSFEKQLKEMVDD